MILLAYLKRARMPRRESTQIGEPCMGSSLPPQPFTRPLPWRVPLPADRSHPPRSSCRALTLACEESKQEESKKENGDKGSSKKPPPPTEKPAKKGSSRKPGTTEDTKTRKKINGPEKQERP